MPVEIVNELQISCSGEVYLTSDSATTGLRWGSPSCPQLKQRIALVIGSKKTNSSIDICLRHLQVVLNLAFMMRGLVPAAEPSLMRFPMKAGPHCRLRTATKVSPRRLRGNVQFHRSTAMTAPPGRVVRFHRTLGSPARRVDRALFCRLSLDARPVEHVAAYVGLRLLRTGSVSGRG